MPDVPNTLRVEVKAMNRRMLRYAKVQTLEDLLKVETLQVLGKKTATLLKGLIFDDDTINPKELPTEDRKLYRHHSNPKSWIRLKGATTQTARKEIAMFKQIVELYGERKIYSHVLNAVNDKIYNLSLIKTVALFLPKHSKRTDKEAA